MKEYLLKLKSQIEADPLTFYDGGDIPALESLYFHYTECYCIYEKCGIPNSEIPHFDSP